MKKQKINKKSLIEAYPEIAAQWHPTKNGDIKPENVLFGSHKKVFWLCLNEHEYEASIKNRAVNKSGCPMCSGRLRTSENSIVATHHNLASQFDFDQNGLIDITTLSANSRVSVWWLCENGHKSFEKICSRAFRKKLCLICYSFGYLKPDLLDEWDIANTDNPFSLLANSNKKIGWICQNCGYRWKASVANRFRDSGCPSCSGAIVNKQNSLSNYPEIIGEWNLIKNGISPDYVNAGSEQSFFWNCQNDHVYEMSPYNRIKRNRSCQICKTLKFNRPDLYEELVNKRADIYQGSGNKEDWKCKICGYIWQTKPASRLHGSGCPICRSPGWTLEKIRTLIGSLIPYLNTFDQAELFAICKQNGSFDSHGKSHHFIKEFVSGKFSKEALEDIIETQEKFEDFVINSNDNLRISDENQELETIVESNLISDKNDLPTVETKDILDSINNKIIASADAETIEFLIQSAVAKIWRHTFKNEEQARLQLKQYNADSEYAIEVKRLFAEGYQGAKLLQIPEGYNSNPPGYIPKKENLALMQRYVAYQIKTRKRFGNWSGTGAGKTLSAILASRVIGARLTVICCPNNVIDTWKNQIKGSYPDSLIYTKVDLPALFNVDDKHKYLILNYEFFQQPDSETKLKYFVNNNKIDFIVIDEIHYSKQRVPKIISKRKALISAFLSEAESNNPDISILGMSATPVINELFEGKSLIELITGVYHEDLDTKATRSNCIALYKKFISYGIRYIPNYFMQLNQVIKHIECSELIVEIRQHKSYVELEAILTKAKLPFILEQLQSKTIIYTHYREGIEYLLYEAIMQKGWRVGLFNGDTKDGLENFINGNVDILIASSCIGTGIDGLQKICNRLIISCLPWTHAEFQQLIGRIYRQGQGSERVDIIIPLTFANINGERWSWCESRWQRIQFKKSIADAAVDGVIPEGHLRTPMQAHKDIMMWFERIDKQGINEFERSKISLSLVSEPKPVALRKIGDITKMNQQINKETSKQTHQRFFDNPQEWFECHEAYSEARKDWDVIPYQEAIKWCQVRPHLIIGDFGCGEAFLSKELKNKVYSFDHVAINDNVIACDISHVPLLEDSIDVAIFSLSLMGTNYVDYLREAKRCLRLDGHLWIAEPTKRIKDLKLFEELLGRLGFDVKGRALEKGKFTFIVALKSERNINEIMLKLLMKKTILD